MASKGDFLPPGPCRSNRSPSTSPRTSGSASTPPSDFHHLHRERPQPQLVLMVRAAQLRLSAAAVGGDGRDRCASCSGGPSRGGSAGALGRVRHLQSGQLLLSVGLQDLFGPTERVHLKSGFSTRILMRVAVEEQADEEPVAVAVQRSEIVYDIWDEKFSVRITRGLGAELRVLAPHAPRGRSGAPPRCAISGRRHRPPAAGRAVRGAGARRSQPDLRGSAGGCASLVGAAGPWAATARRRRQLLRLVRQHLREPAHRGQRASGALRISAVPVHRDFARATDGAAREVPR